MTPFRLKRARKKFKRFLLSIIRMLIGFNVLDTDSVFAKGSNRTALSFAFWCCENGHSVFFLSPTGNTNQFIEIKELLAEKKITLLSIDSFLSTEKQFDILFEISFFFK
jgi:hypothetical protein